VLLGDRTPRDHRHLPLERDEPFVEIDGRPLDSEQLAETSAGEEAEQQELVKRIEGESAAAVRDADRLDARRGG
jgi:hypothetical protein